MPHAPSRASAHPRAVLVTGASRGIGAVTIRRLARGGFIVYAGVRSEADAQILRDEDDDAIRPLRLDVTEAESIAAARLRIGTDGFALAGLVNNAAIAIGGPLETIPMSELRRQFDVNFFATIALTQAFLPLLRRDGGRIVNVSSIGGKLALPFVGAYAASKFALEAASDALRLELRPLGVGVSVIEPGAVKTGMWERGSDETLRMLDEVPKDTRASYDDMIRSMVRVSQKMAERGTEPERVAAAIERALLDTKPRARYLVGNDARMRLLIARLPEGLRDRAVAAFVGASTKAPRKKSAAAAKHTAVTLSR